MLSKLKDKTNYRPTFVHPIFQFKHHYREALPRHHPGMPNSYLKEHNPLLAQGLLSKEISYT